MASPGPGKITFDVPDANGQRHQYTLDVSTGQVTVESDDRQTIYAIGPQGQQGPAGPAGPAGSAGAGSIPSGVVVMWSGAVNAVPDGWALCDGFNGTPDLRDKFIRGAGAEAPGVTGGAAAASHTPAGTISGTAVADHAAHTHAVTSNVAVADHTVTQPTVAWPAGVPTASGAAVADHAAHTHSVTAAGTNSAPTFTGNAVVAASTNSGTKLVTGNTSTGVSPVTTATGSVSAPTFTGSAVTSGNPSATLTHGVTQPTVAWPAGVPTATGAGVNAHSVTNNAVTSGNPSATLTHGVTNGTFAGQAASIATVPPYFVLAYIIKL